MKPESRRCQSGPTDVWAGTVELAMRFSTFSLNHDVALSSLICIALSVGACAVIAKKCDQMNVKKMSVAHHNAGARCDSAF
jgi:hypothetical protein